MKGKTMRLTLMVTLAIGLLAAPSAAAEDFFHSDAQPTILTGEATTKQFFVIAGVDPIRCKKMRSFGTQSTSTAGEITIYAFYEECVRLNSEGKEEAVRIENPCDYLLGSKTTGGEASVQIKCGGSEKIRIYLSATCTLEIAPQTVPGVSYSGVGTAEGTLEETKTRDLVVDYGFELPFTKVGACTGINPSKGTLSGTFTLRGFEDLAGSAEGGQVGFWWGPSEGAQIGIWEESTLGKDIFRADWTSAILTGSGAKTTFTVEKLEGPLLCQTVRLTGTALDKSESVTFRPRYDGCTLFTELGPLVVVNTQGCAYVLGAETKEGLAKLQVECNAGRKIQLVNSLCTFEIGEQVATGGVAYSNTGTLEETSKRDLDLTFNATLALTKAATGLCPFFGSKLTLSGSATVKGYKDLG